MTHSHARAYTSPAARERSERRAQRERVSPRLERFEDLLQHHRLSMQNIVVPETQHAPALTLQPIGAAQVIRGLRMLPAVGFDDQPLRHADEIGDKRADRMLSTELCRGEAPGTEQIPEQSLGISHVVAKLAGDLVCHRGKVAVAGEGSAYVRRRDPLPRRMAARPLPQAGEVYL